MQRNFRRYVDRVFTDEFPVFNIREFGYCMHLRYLGYFEKKYNISLYSKNIILIKYFTIKISHIKSIVI